MTSDKLITIILPNYNDPRVSRAIQSVVEFDDIDSTIVLVVDGNSNTEVKELARQSLRKQDVFFSEPDNGIFDALNKGLSKVSTPYLGWLGSDDVFSGQVKASDVVRELENNDLFVCDISFFHDGYVTRKTHSLPSRMGFMKIGLHNPHYATFGRSDLLKSERFRLDVHGSDIDYFLKVFRKKARISGKGVVATYQAEGGYSNQDSLQIIKTNIELLPLFGLYGPIAIFVKLFYKATSKLYFKIFRERVSIQD